MTRLVVDCLLAWRNLVQRARRTLLLGAAIALVTALTVLLFTLGAGVGTTMQESATAIWSGHVNVGGFYKITSGRAAPLVSEYPLVMDKVKQLVPELDFAVERGRGWAQASSHEGLVGISLTGVDLNADTRLLSLLRVASGSLHGLKEPKTIALFEEQANKLNVKVNDAITLSAPTNRGTSNTIDLRVAAIAKDIGLLSSITAFVPMESLRALYQWRPDATGVIQLILKKEHASDAPEVAGRLRATLEQAGYRMMTHDPRPYWMKFYSVQREDWTGQKLDVTTWEDEVSFIAWTVKVMNGLSAVVATILMGIVVVGIMNTMWVAVRERTREIGTLRAIGMQRAQILRLLLLEGLMLGLLATGAGAVLGASAAGLVNLMEIDVPASIRLFLMSEKVRLLPETKVLAAVVLAITTAVGFAALYPAIRAGRLRPLDAMSHFK